MRDDPLSTKSFAFSLRIVKLYKYLSDEKKEFVMSKQILRSGTAIGALISEAEFGQSKADFINKMYIALKEANETRYWIRLLSESGYLTKAMYQNILPDVEELIRLLVASTKTAKENNEK